MRAQELSKRAFLALYHKSMSEGVRNYDLLDVTRQSGAPLASGLDRMIAEKLSANGWVTIHEAKHLDDEEHGFVGITWAGIEAAEEMLEGAERGGVLLPASDRYVLISDNLKVDVSESLEALKELAGGANDAGEEDRLIVLSEIAAFEATIVQPRVSTDLIQRFVDLVLAWIKRTFTAAAVQDVAQRLVQALLKLIA